MSGEGSDAGAGVVIRGLNVAYGDKTVFDGLNLEFEKHRINVVLGSSGVGKTTLLNAVAGLIDFGGTIEGAEGGVSYIFQKDRLIPSITVFKNLDLVLKRIIPEKKERINRIDAMLRLVEIHDQRDKLPGELSGGQAQRAALARAFLYPSEVLLMDEPFRALDTALKSRLLSVLAMLNEVSPRTVIFVTHAIDECLLSADNCFVLGKSPAGVVFSESIAKPARERSLSDDELDALRVRLLHSLFDARD